MIHNMFQHYLKTIGLNKLAKEVTNYSLNNFVNEVFQQSKKEFTDAELTSLYTYDIPKLSPDGSCSILEEKNDIPYNLAHTFGLSEDVTKLASNPHTLRLWRLHQITQKVYDKTRVAWFGIYRKIESTKASFLVKESYLGIFSRPEFPLTEIFALKSNNSTVGLRGKAIVIQDIENHSGAYYKCDGKVQSEFCTPIFNKRNDIIGILDAEAFPKNFFADERLLEIAKVAYDLGEINLGM